MESVDSRLTTEYAFYPTATDTTADLNTSIGLGVKWRWTERGEMESAATDGGMFLARALTR